MKMVANIMLAAAVMSSPALANDINVHKAVQAFL